MKKMRREDEKNELNSKKKYLPVIIFAAVIVLSCFIIFILNYEDAYVNGGIVPKSWAVKFYYFLATVVFIGAAVFIKIATKKRIKLSVLLLTAILTPILCWNINYHTFKEGGIFYSLVSRGGILHSFTIGDYNFDGMNDEEYKRRYKERENTGYYGMDYDPIISSVETKAVGTGTGLGWCLPGSNDELKGFHLHLTREDLVLNRIEVTVKLNDPSMAEKVSFYRLNGKERIYVDQTVNADGSISFTLSSEACAQMQSELKSEYDEINFYYRISD